MMTLIAATGYKIEKLTTKQEFWSKTTKIVEEAKSQGAECVLFPEYVGMEWIFLHDSKGYEQVSHATSTLPDYLSGFQYLAQEHDIYIASGSILTQLEAYKYANRCYLFSPYGKYAHQDKLMLTAWEAADSYLVAGHTQTVFHTRFGTMAIAICYDSEFHGITSPLVAAGANFILIPSYTDSWHGFYRVHLAARARAMENQCFTIHACALGQVEDSIILDELAVGYSGIYGPVDGGFPQDGILLQADCAEETSVYCVPCDQDALETVRRTGQVRNHRDQLKVQGLEIKINPMEL